MRAWEFNELREFAVGPKKVGPRLIGSQGCDRPRG